MSFKVSIEQIVTSIPHPNADRLDISMLEGMSFQFVTGRGQFKPGDKIIYYPVDSILPQPIIDRMGLTNLLAGREKNRVKTVRLRDAISQGVVEPIYGPSFDGRMCSVGEDVTELLGVLKWEPEPIQCHIGTIVPVSTIGVSKYDVEGADRHPDVVELLMDQQVCVTEKLEGSNFSVTVTRDGGRFVNQREHTIVPDVDPTKVHSFWRAAEEQQMFRKAGEFLNLHGGERVTMYGEYIGPGVQKNIYKLTKNEVRFFDVKVDHTWLGIHALMQILSPSELVPILAQQIPLREWLLNGRTLQLAADGESKLASGVMREGVVIRPMTEQRHQKLGRLILKQRGPEYLLIHDL